MKTIKRIMTLAVAWVCAVAQAGAAGRVAPTNPTLKVADLQDSTEVYLFNIGSDNAWMHYNPEASSYMLYPRAVDNNPCKLSVLKTEEGTYHFELVDYGRALGVWSRNWYIECNTYDRGSDFYYDFVLSDSANAVTIQMASNYAYYNESHYLGWSSNNDGFHRDLTNGNIYWLIVPATDKAKEEALYYAAQLRLYHALVSSDAYNFNVDKYEEIYANEESTAEELTAAAAELNNALDLSAYAQTSLCGGDYPILLEDDPSHAWERYGNYLRRDGNMSSGETQTLTATVVVDEDATIYYEPYNYNRCPDYDFRLYAWDNDNHGMLWEGNRRFVSMEVFVDDSLVRTIDNHALGYDGYRYFEELSPGKHTIKWVASCETEGQSGQYIDIQYIRVHRTPLTSVTLQEPGSLSNEIRAPKESGGGGLRQVKNVRRLKIKGLINDADWAIIDNIDSLYALDLSEVPITEIPAKQLSRVDKSDTKSFLHEVKLPSALEKLGDAALKGCWIDDLDFPSTLRSIGNEALYHTYLRKALLPNKMQSIGNDAFAYNFSLQEAHLPDSIDMLGTDIFSSCFWMEKCNLPLNLTSIPNRLFLRCYELHDVTQLYEGLTHIGQDAFYGCFNYPITIPKTLTSVENGAFIYCRAMKDVTLNPNMSLGYAAFVCSGLESLEVPEGVSIGNHCFMYNYDLKHLTLHNDVGIGSFAFGRCYALEDIELPTSIYSIDTQYPWFKYDSAIKQVKLRSSTKVGGSYKTDFSSGWSALSGIKLIVPDYLYGAYDDDDYWQSYNIVTYDNAEQDYWQIRQPLTLTYRDRFQGNPDVDVNGPGVAGQLTIKGDAAMNINNLNTFLSQNALIGDWGNWGGMILSNCDNVVINGKLEHGIYTTDNIWYAMSLPFDFKVSDIRTENGAKFAIRYYDGAHRAEYGNGDNWRDFPSDTIVTAGTGFIYRTSKGDYSWFTAQNNGSKQIIVSNNEFAKQLEKNESEEPEHKGWNLVGNPYLCYYNIHKLNTTAPITVFQHGWVPGGWQNNYYIGPDAGSYKAYSLIDDDYALLPNAAFFLQCPDEATTITFPTTGRQLTSEIEDQNGVKAFMQRPEMRKLIDLTLSTRASEESEYSEYSENSAPKDQTRVVFNAAASLGYERNCDAGKFLAEDKTLPQLYTLDEDGTRYAINERPTCGEATVPMGVIIPRAGTYYIYVSRNRQAGTVLLLDRETGTTTDITDTPYSFYADAGTHNDRFLLVAKSLATGIEEVESSKLNVDSLMGEAYDMSGRRVRMNQMTPGVYVVRQGKKTQKITVK